MSALYSPIYIIHPPSANEPGWGVVLGTGSPSGVVVAFPGTIYVDTNTGNMYVKETGTDANGWSLITGGGGGGSGLVGAGSPAGVQAASPGTTYFDTVGQNFWVKQTGSGTSGWTELIGS